ncbi:hypothetical protein GCM10007989_06410 [Devosia pacifica]|uniref:CENP-V/GFA domain-containing protein n=1 Tax=Devosia pacifica TaxID=1335967 RepID=A0A918VQ99_9HYPH|nr:hypothetical protein GCM10007989_06410 [Devosia pacifica]
MLLCGCNDCQRATGAGHSSTFIVSASALEISGNTKSFTRPADSGATFTRHFCPECGTIIYGQSSRAGDLRLVPVGLFAGQNDWFAASRLIFCESHPAWDSLGEDLPQVAGYGDGT